MEGYICDNCEEANPDTQPLMADYHCTQCDMDLCGLDSCSLEKHPCKVNNPGKSEEELFEEYDYGEEGGDPDDEDPGDEDPDDEPY